MAKGNVMYYRGNEEPVIKNKEGYSGGCRRILPYFFFYSSGKRNVFWNHIISAIPVPPY